MGFGPKYLFKENERDRSFSTNKVGQRGKAGKGPRRYAHRRSEARGLRNRIATIAGERSHGQGSSYGIGQTEVGKVRN